MVLLLKNDCPISIFSVWGVTNWAFSVWGSNCTNSVDLHHILCISAQLSPPATWCFQKTESIAYLQCFEHQINILKTLDWRCLWLWCLRIFSGWSNRQVCNLTFVCYYSKVKVAMYWTFGEKGLINSGMYALMAIDQKYAKKWPEELRRYALTKV